MPVAIAIHLVIHKSAFLRWPRYFVLPSEQTTRQGIVREDRNVESCGHRQEFLLNSTSQQVIHLLRYADRLIGLSVSDHMHLANLPTCIVGTRRETDFPLIDHAFQRRQRLLKRDGVIGLVKVIDIEVVRLKTTQ